MCAIGIICYLAAQFGEILVLRPQMIWPLWPGCALLVAVLLLMPLRLWPAVIAFGIAGFSLSDIRSGLPLRSIVLLDASDVVEILVAALGATYLFCGRPRLLGARALSKFLFVVAIIAPMAAAPISAFALKRNYVYALRTSFLTEALAMLTLTTAILGWADLVSNRKRTSRRFYAEGIVLIVLLTIAACVIFVIPADPQMPELLYLLIPCLLWAALRFGTMGIGTSMLIVAFISIWGTNHGRGPFTLSHPLMDVTPLQLFLLFAATPFMFLAALAEEEKRAAQSVRESEERFRLVANTAPVMIWISGPDKLCYYFNQPWLDFRGRTIEQEIGNGWVKGVHPDDRQRCVDTYVHAFDHRQAFRMEYRLRRRDGQYRWILDLGVPRFMPDRSFAGYIGSCVDVTDAKLAETQVRQANERLRLAMEAGGIGGWEWSSATGENTWFGETYSLMGLSREEESRSLREFWDRVHPEDRAPLRDILDGAKQNHTEFDHEFRVVWPNGTVHWIQSKGKYLYATDGQPERIVGISHEITERKRAEEMLAGMSRRLIEAQDAERGRIARELHDDIGQRLALAAVRLDSLRHAPKGLEEDARATVTEILEQISDTSSSIHNLSHQLHSSSLKHLGVVVTMRRLCRDVATKHGVEIDFHDKNVPTDLPADISLSLFRVLQEALQNAVKHSGVRHFDVHIYGDENAVHLTVRDLGVGFDLESAMGSGLGLMSMEERVNLVHGTFSIQSQPKRGTAIYVHVPLRSPGSSSRLAG